MIRKIKIIISDFARDCSSLNSNPGLPSLAKNHRILHETDQIKSSKANNGQS